MKCPACGAWTFVKETRKQDDQTKKRRYECANEHRFYTVETLIRVITTPKKLKYKALELQNEQQADSK